MASLTNLYWDGITPDMRRLLSYLGQQSFIQRFYLGSGSALALQIGHRRSVDFDFFSETAELNP